MYHIQLLMARNLAELISLIAGSYLSIWGRIATPVMEILIQRDTKTFYLFLCLSGGLSDVWETHKTWVRSSALFKQAASLPPALTSVIWKFWCLHVCKHWLGINVPHHLQDAQKFLDPSIYACTCTTLCHLHCTKQKRWLIRFFSTPTKFAMTLNSHPYDLSSALASTCPRGMCFSNVVTELPLLKLREVLTWADQRIWISAQKLHDNSQVASCGIRHG